MKTGLSAIVYGSHSISLFSDTDLFYLLAQARERNGRMGLSGVLVYDRGRFFQWLEGADDALGKVWGSIRSDERHRDLDLLVDQEIPVRLFEGWHMQFAHRDRQHARIVSGFVEAAPEALDRLHQDDKLAPNVLAAFSRLAPPG